MNVNTTCALTAFLIATNTFAATAPAKPKPVSVDVSSSFLIDEATSEKIWNDNLPARVKKLYPVKRWRFVSDIGGGFTESKTCVITARAMVLPLRGKDVIFDPEKSATTFDAVPNLSKEQCQELARAKLKEAIQAVTSSIAAS